jgi:hypothetical protein
MNDCRLQDLSTPYQQVIHIRIPVNNIFFGIQKFNFPPPLSQSQQIPYTSKYYYSPVAKHSRWLPLKHLILSQKKRRQPLIKVATALFILGLNPIFHTFPSIFIKGSVIARPNPRLILS